MSIGQALGTVVGAVAGFFIGGPAGAWKGAYYGAQVGYVAGGLLDPPKGPTQYGPRLSDLSAQTSTYGAPIPRIYGVMPVVGNVFWLEGDAIKETTHKTTQKSGGKGGGGGSTTTITYTYSATFAVGLCEGPITGVRRIWIGHNLVYDAGTDDIQSVIASNALAKNMTIYTGSATQMPNSRMQADKGAANVPAYRGLAYIVFHDLQLKDYGNTLMGAQVKVEVVKAGSISAWARKTSTAGVGTLVWGSGRPYIIDCDGVVRVGIVGSTDCHVFSLSGDYLYKTVLGVIPCEFVGGPFWGIGRLGGELTRVYAGGVPSSTSTLVRFDPETGVYARIDQNLPQSLAVVCTAIANDGASVLVISMDVDSIYSGQPGGSWTLLDSSGGLIASGPVSGSISNNIYLWGFSRSRAYHYRACAYDQETGMLATAYGAGGGEVHVYKIVNGVLTLLQQISPGLSAFSFTSPTVYVRNGVVHAFSGTFYNAYWGGNIATASPALSAIVEAEALMAGSLAAGDLALSSLTSFVRGYRVPGVMSLRGVIEPLQGAYPFDLVQSGYKIKAVPRGQASALTLTLEECVADDAGVRLAESREMDTQLPRRLSLKYLDADREYDIGEQYAERVTTGAVNVIEIDMALALTSTEAAQQADVLLYLYWMERTSFVLRLPPSMRAVEPADIITVIGQDLTYELRLVDVHYMSDGVIECQAKINKASSYVSPAAGASGSVAGAVIGLAGPTYALMLDLPCITADLDAPACVASASGYLSGWGGSVIYRSADGGQTWTQITAFDAPCTTGIATTTLAAGPTHAIDAAGVLGVRMVYGDLFSVSHAALLNGENHFAYGINGRWEIIAAQNCVLQGDGSYLLTNLLRGRAGTEHNVGNHAAGDLLIHLNDGDLQRVGMDTALIGAARLYRAVTAGADIDSAADASFTYAATNLLPLSPVWLNGNRHPSTNDWTLTWIRRTRSGGEWRDFVDAPLSEAAESYEVEIWTSGYGTLKRTITGLITPAATYTSAQQVTDFGSNQTTLHVRVFQLSATVGRGTPLSTSITR